VALREVQTVLADISENTTLQLFSSLKKTGVAEAEAVLGGWMDMAIKEEAPPPVGLRTEKVARPKNRKAIGWSARSVKPASKSK
jgi:GTP-binding protein